jgi:hypothetical protein
MSNKSFFNLSRLFTIYYLKYTILHHQIKHFNTIKKHKREVVHNFVSAVQNTLSRLSITFEDDIVVPKHFNTIKKHTFKLTKKKHTFNGGGGAAAAVVASRWWWCCCHLTPTQTQHKIETKIIKPTLNKTN